MEFFFDNNSLEALDILNKEQSISNEFFYYWNDMLNTIGSSSKLLLIFCALEALAKSQKIEKYKFFEEILGKELKDKMFAPRVGIRHRLMHGEYLSEQSGNENYLDQVYKKVIQYFNKTHLKKNLISEDITNPQRNPYGNKEGGDVWLRSEASQFDLKALVNECDKSGIYNINNSERILNSDVQEDY